MNAAKTCWLGLEGTAVDRATTYFALGLLIAGLIGACGNSGQSNSPKDAAVGIQQNTGAVPTVDAKDGVYFQPTSIMDASVEHQILEVETGRADGHLDVSEDAPNAIDDTGAFDMPRAAILDGSVVDSSVVLDVAGLLGLAIDHDEEHLRGIAGPA